MKNTLPSLKNKKFKLVHLDCDFYQSYKIRLEFLYDRALPGGYMVFDEYKRDKCTYLGAQRAIDEFLKYKPEKIQCFEETKRQRFFIKKL